LPPCFGITLPSMIIGIDTTMVSTLVIFIFRAREFFVSEFSSLSVERGAEQTVLEQLYSMQ
jgi:hypothetical protein